MTEIADALLRRHEALKSTRATWDSHWQQLAEVIRPIRADFSATPSPGAKRTGMLYDATAPLAAENLASGLWGMITNAANRWFDLKPQDPDLEDLEPVRAWLDVAAARMRAIFSAHGGQFYTRVFELYADLGTFGTAVFYSEEDVGTGHIRFATVPLASAYIAEDAMGRIDTVFREITMTARQAAQRFGKDRCGVKVARVLDREPDRTFPFLHAVYPNEDFIPGRLGERGKAIASVYLSVEDRHVCRQSGFSEMPFQVPRWATAAGRSMAGPPPCWPCRTSG